MLTRFRLAMAAIAIPLAMAASDSAAGSHGTISPYRVDVRMETEPGGIVSSMPISLRTSGAKGWRVVYRSSGTNGEQVEVSGVVIAPDATPPPEGWPVVAWAHGTTGIARQCAPSLDHEFERNIPGLQQLIASGYIVAATDYQGLGTPGPHPYLVGTSAAYSVLDSVRAARSVAGAGSRFVVYGHSQGGHAALWTGQLAPRYAPDLELLGVAAIAPASELAALLNADLSTPAGKAFSGLALLSWSRIYGADLASIIEPHAVVGLEVVAQNCMNSPLGLLGDAIGIHLLPKEVLRADPTRTQPWSAIIADNTPRSIEHRVPVLFAQGTDDTVIAPSITRDFARGLCRSGSSVELVQLSGDHISILKNSQDDVIRWLVARVSGAQHGNDCSTMDGG